MSMGETANNINRLCGMAAEKFSRSAFGKFDASQIRADILSLRTQGLIRPKTQAEIDADLKQIEKEIKSLKRPGRGGYRAKCRLDKIKKIENLRKNGRTLAAACEEAETHPKTYRKWKKEFHAQEPKRVTR